MSNNAPAPRVVDAVIAGAHVHRVAERPASAELQRAERAIRGDLQHRTCPRVVRPHVGLEDGEPCRLGVVEQLLALRRRQRERLLAQHVLAGVERTVAPDRRGGGSATGCTRHRCRRAPASRRTARSRRRSCSVHRPRRDRADRTPASANSCRCGWIRRRLPNASCAQHDHADLGHLLHRVGRSLAGVAAVAQAAVRLLIGSPRGYLVDQYAAVVERVNRRADALLMSAVKMAACNPNDESLASSNASSSDRRTSAMATTGPNTSFEHTFMSGLALAMTVGRSTPSSSTAPPVSTFAPPASASVDPRHDAVASRCGDQRRHVGRLVERIADHERVDVIDQRRGEVVGDRRCTKMRCVEMQL